jgi:hypothetical protein
MAVTKYFFHRMRPYDTIEKSSRNQQLDSEEEKAKKTRSVPYNQCPGQ